MHTIIDATVMPDHEKRRYIITVMVMITGCRKFIFRCKDVDVEFVADWLDEGITKFFGKENKYMAKHLIMQSYGEYRKALRQQCKKDGIEYDPFLKLRDWTPILKKRLPKPIKRKKGEKLNIICL